MKVRDLMLSWEEKTQETGQQEKYQVKLPFRDAARLEALVGMYPGVNKTELIAQLLSAAIDEIEAQMPYKQGSRVVALDELGDPMYEDVGLTPKYLELRQQIAKNLHKRKSA